MGVIVSQGRGEGEPFLLPLVVWLEHHLARAKRESPLPVDGAARTMMPFGERLGEGSSHAGGAGLPSPGKWAASAFQT